MTQEKIIPDKDLIQRKMPTLGWSWSRVSMYRECPLKLYYYAFVKLPKPVVPVPMQIGQVEHEIIAKVIQKAIYLRKNTEDGYDFDIDYALELLKEKATRFSATILSRIWNDIKNVVVNFSLPDRNYMASCYTEEKFAFDENNKRVGWLDNPMFRMVVDYLQINYEDGNVSLSLIDWKSGKSGDFEQLRLYAGFLNKLSIISEKVRGTKVSLFYTSKGISESEFITPEKSDLVLDSFLEEVGSIMEKEALDPTPSSEVCFSCDYRSVCPYSVFNEETEEVSV